MAILTVTRSATELSMSAANDSRRARANDLVVAHLGIAEKLARRYTAGFREYDDLRQVAMVGLIKASQRFDPDKGRDFASFAVPTVVGELKRHLRDHGWTIRPPRRIQELWLRIAKARDSISQRLGRDPSTEDLATALHADRDDVREALAAENGMRPLSLDAPVHEDGDELGCFVSTGSSGQEHAEQLAMIASAVKRLAPREREIVYLRFHRDQTQQEISRAVGVTQMHVSRLLARALDDLRENLVGPAVVPIRTDAHAAPRERCSA